LSLPTLSDEGINRASQMFRVDRREADQLTGDRLEQFFEARTINQTRFTPTVEHCARAANEIDPA
jgi:hypothetical protein